MRAGRGFSSKNTAILELLDQKFKWDGHTSGVLTNEPHREGLTKIEECHLTKLERCRQNCAATSYSGNYSTDRGRRISQLIGEKQPHLASLYLGMRPIVSNFWGRRLTHCSQTSQSSLTRERALTLLLFLNSYKRLRRELIAELLR